MSRIRFAVPAFAALSLLLLTPAAPVHAQQQTSTATGGPFANCGGATEQVTLTLDSTVISAGQPVDGTLTDTLSAACVAPPPHTPGISVFISGVGFVPLEFDAWTVTDTSGNTFTYPPSSTSFVEPCAGTSTFLSCTFTVTLPSVANLVFSPPYIAEFANVDLVPPAVSNCFARRSAFSRFRR